MEKIKCAKCGNAAEVLYTITASSGDGESADVSMAGGAFFCDACLKKIQTFALKPKAKPPLTPRRKRVEVDLDALVTMYKAGRSYKDIALTLGVSECVINDRCARLRAEGIIGKKPLMTIDSGKVIALRKAGWSIGQIATEMSTSEEAVSEIVLKAAKSGVQMNRTNTRKALEWNDNNDDIAMTQRNVHSSVTVMAEKEIYY